MSRGEVLVGLFHDYSDQGAMVPGSASETRSFLEAHHSEHHVQKFFWGGD